jgi:hypothetical protein
MAPSTYNVIATEAKFPHRLRFTSLHNRGRGVSIPCDVGGKVDLDGLPERLRLAYVGARAMVGRDYSFPTVELATA